MNEFCLSSPESAGMSSAILLRMMRRLNDLKYVNSVIVLRHERSVLEAWQEPYRREMPHQLFSLSKSFTSCAVGLAQAEGRLKITDKLVSFFPEYDSCITDPRMRDVTLEDLLTMRSGHLVCATGNWYHPDPGWEAPYEALVPRDLDGLLAAGYAWEIFRVIPAAALTGEAAGIAAALCAQGEILPRNLPYDVLKSRLHSLRA